MITQEFDINIVPHGLPPRVEVDQYDTGLRTLIAHIYQDDTPLVMTDEYTYTVIGTKPSGTGFSYPATVENGAVVIDVTGQMTVVSGLVKCGIIVWSGNNRVGTHRFNLWVQPSALQVETIIDSNDFDSIIEDAIENALADAVNKTLPIDTASGSIASFSDGANNALVEDLTVSIVPKQAGNGTPSPSNVRAISGFTKATIKRSGKNLLKNTLATQTKNGITFTVNEDGSVKLSGTASADATVSVSLPLKAGSFVYSSGITESFTTIDTYLGGSSGVIARGNSSSPGPSFSLSSDDTITLYIRVHSGATANATVQPMIRPASITDATYEPYTADTYEVSFGSAGTVYGGTLDVTTGKLTVTRRIIDLGTFSASYWAVVDAAKGIFRLNLSSTNTGGNPRKIYTGTQVDDPGLSDQYSFGLSNNEATIKASLLDGQYAFGVNGTLTYYRNAACSTAAQIASAMSGVQFVYPLATPIEVNLTPTEVRTLLGANNIWSDTGDATVTYRADTGLYIDKRIAEVQALVLD